MFFFSVSIWVIRFLTSTYCWSKVLALWPSSMTWTYQSRTSYSFSSWLIRLYSCSFSAVKYGNYLISFACCWQNKMIRALSRLTYIVLWLIQNILWLILVDLALPKALWPLCHNLWKELIVHRQRICELCCIHGLHGRAVNSNSLLIFYALLF